MSKIDLLAVILAAGEGKRMKSALPKVLHKVCEKPMVEWVLDAATACGATGKVVVIGNGADTVRDTLGDSVHYALQAQQLGTGHAVIMAKNRIEQAKTVLVLSGDTPLISPETLSAAYQHHKLSQNSATVLTSQTTTPFGYGRIVKNGDKLAKIVEERDATSSEKAIEEINSGIYFFESAPLLTALGKMTDDNAQKEYYLTQTIEIMLNSGHSIGTYNATIEDILGVNDRVQLHTAQTIMQKCILTKHLLAGITIIDANSTYIGPDVIIKNDTIIYPQTFLEGKTEIGENTTIRQSRIADSKIGDHTEVQNSVILQSTVGNDTKIGPFAYLRPNSVVGDHIKIGDFVEIKNSTIGDGTKISHLSYVGDADIGRKVNIGCGAVVVNYDGVRKHRSIVHDNAFIGCNVNLISPVTLDPGCFIAAGSTITDDVPKDSLAIARSRQVVKENWKNKQKSE